MPGVVTVAVGLLALATATPAAAAVPPQSHCWLDLAAGTTRCFSSFERSVEAVTGGRVTVSRGATSLTDTQRARIAGATGGAYVLGSWFESADYGGASYVVTGSTDCDTNPDVDWQLGVMPSGWNDRISSFRSYGLCATRIWDNTYGGASYGFVVNSTYVGATMNDRASSVQWN